MLHAILSSDEELLSDLEVGRDASRGFTMNVFGRAEEVLTYPWWKGHLSRERMFGMGEKLWEESAKLLRSIGH